MTCPRVRTTTPYQSRRAGVQAPASAAPEGRAASPAPARAVTKSPGAPSAQLVGATGLDSLHCDPFCGAVTAISPIGILIYLLRRRCRECMMREGALAGGTDDPGGKGDSPRRGACPGTPG